MSTLIKAELFDLGPHNGMREPNTDGSYHAFTLMEKGYNNDEPQSLSFIVPAHQLPVRADLCAPTQDARVKALEAENARLRDDLADAMTAIEECKDEIDQSIINEYPHDHPVQERYRKRDFAANPARMFLDRRAALRALEQGEA